MSVVLCLFLLSVLVGFLTWYYQQKQKFRSLDHVQGPPTLPILGNVLQIGNNPLDSFKFINRTLDRYGPISRIWIGQNKVIVLMSDPDFCELILSSSKYIKKSVDYNMLRPWLENGLILSNGKYWHKRRKLITPAFHFKILDQFIPVFNTKCDLLLQNLSKEVGNEACNIYKYITAYTLDTICETAMGTTVNVQTNLNHEYANAVKTMCQIFVNRCFSVWKQFDSLFKFSNTYKLQTRVLNIIKGFSLSVIEKRRRALEANSELDDSVDDLGLKKRTFFLDVLLKSTIDNQPLSDADIREEVDTFMFAGHDTTASAISFALYEIARNPEVQGKIFEELDSMFCGDKTRQPTIQDLNNMKYLELVIKESLRLYPSVPFFARELEEDIIYKGNLYQKGVIISCIIFHMHRRADLFPNPETFDPDRFLPENVVGRHPYAYIPFSAGPRNCIGQKFAMYQLKTVLSNVCRNFKLLAADSKYDIILASEALLKSTNDVHIKVEKRR